MRVSIGLNGVDLCHGERPVLRKISGQLLMRQRLGGQLVLWGKAVFIGLEDSGAAGDREPLRQMYMNQKLIQIRRHMLGWNT